MLRIVVLAFVLAFLTSGCATRVDWDYPRTSSTAFTQPQTTTVGALFQEVADRHATQSGFALLLQGHRAFTARLALADLAEKTLDVQYYIWDSDTTGRIMAEHLIRAADRGVRVRLLLDDHYQSEENDLKVAALDAHPNIEVRIFNPVENRRWRTLSFLSEFSRANHRMHNKLFVADNAVGIVGGRNIADVYFGVRPDSNFRDLDVAMAGPIVRDLSASFDVFWNSKWSVPAGAIVSQQVTQQEYLAAKRRLDQNIAAAGYPYPVDESVADLRERLVEVRDKFIWAPGRVFAENPSRVDAGDDGEVIYQALRERVQQTRHELLIESPYLILNDRTIRGVKALTARNVKVRILTNSAATNDVIAAHAGYAETREDLINAGAELYELRPDSNMKRDWSITAGKSRAALHAKALVFDRESVFIGSFNLDPRSTAINTEIGVMIDSPEIARQLGAFMDEGVSPGSAFRVTLDQEDHLAWTADTNGTKVTLDSDPETTFWQRLMIDTIGLLPIDDQL
ncbi:MAG TPA: phospholipase D family protein [Dongiaceae bacterium]|nr:phospholipase D family protein [Dongiaceae bacterium]